MEGRDQVPSQKMSSIKTLSFDEIIPGNSVRVTSDGMIYAVDLTMVITGKNRDDAGMVLRRLPEEMSDKLTEKKTGGQGNYRTKLVSFNDALELIMVLPGKMAKEMRSKFADIIKRYLAGDGALLKEVQANAKSSHPIAQMARESLAADVDPDEKVLETRKRKLEIDIMESKARFEEESRTLQIQKERLEFIKSLSPSGVIDDQVRMMFKDGLMNSLRNDAGQQPITDPSMQPVCLSAVATKLGFIFDGDQLKEIGKNLKVAYVDVNGKLPGKHESIVNGDKRMVNLYTKKDMPIIEKIMRNFQATIKRAGHNKTLAQFWQA